MMIKIKTQQKSLNIYNMALSATQVCVDLIWIVWISTSISIGKKGSDISRVFERGLQVYKDTERGQGAGEIVVQKSYFEQYLSADFEYPRLISLPFLPSPRV
jgi:hypothetical protein